MTWTQKCLRVILPVDRATEMRTTAIQNDDVFGIFRFANCEPAVTRGRSFPAIDLDARERKWIRPADLHVCDFADGNPRFFSPDLKAGSSKYDIAGSPIAA